jgi:glycosyltransferase involved in cell wall biosynthesis
MKLSVAMLTYNHEKYIAQALDSILMQQVDFDYEIVIGDDLSQDRTREILLAYQAKHPDKIRLLLYETKQGVGGNSYQVLSTCRGQYIAFLEGDDYWTSPDKLQTQVKFLDSNLDCSACFSATLVYSEKQGTVIGRTPSISDDSHKISSTPKYSLQDVLEDKVLPKTCSVMFRAKLYPLPTWLVDITNVDTVLLTLNTEHGYLGYIDEVFAAYRVHDGGVWSGANSLSRNLFHLQTFETLSSHYNHVYDRYFRIQMRYLTVARAYETLGERQKAKYYFRKAIMRRYDSSLTPHMVMSAFLCIYTPSLFSFLRSLYRSRVPAG